jgi:hypothetical protein
MKPIYKMAICFFSAYTLIMIESLLMPKIAWLRVGVLFLLMFSALLIFYFWLQPKRLWETTLWLSISLAPVAEILSLIRHMVMFHDLTIYSATFPFIFGLSLPYFCASVYQIFQLRKMKSPEQSASIEH